MDMNLISYETVVKDLEAHPAKRIFWRSGWAFPGRIPRLSSPTRLRPRSLFRLSPVTLPISR